MLHITCTLLNRTEGHMARRPSNEMQRGSRAVTLPLPSVLNRLIGEPPKKPQSASQLRESRLLVTGPVPSGTTGTPWSGSRSWFPRPRAGGQPRSLKQIPQGKGASDENTADGLSSAVPSGH